MALRERGQPFNVTFDRAQQDASRSMHQAACSVAARNGKEINSFVVRKAEKAHGLQRRIEGPDVVGKRVLAVEDTSTTGGSVLTAVEALKEAGAIVVGVAVIVERGAKQAIIDAGYEYRAAFQPADLGL